MSLVSTNELSNKITKVFVTGATGTSGMATVRALRAKGVDVIAGVHSLEKAAPLEQLGVVVKQLNYADIEEMMAAMRGANRLYLVTPVTPETEQLTASIVKAAKAAGVTHIAKLSGLNVDAKPGFELGRWHQAAEQVIVASGLQWTFLRPNSFMQNFLGDAESVKAQGTFYNPSGSAAISFIDARDIGEVAATVLTTDGHAGKIYNLTGPKAITNADIAAQLTIATGKTVTYTPVTFEQTFETLQGFGLPRVVAVAVVELMENSASGNSSAVSPDAERLLGHPPRDFIQFVNDFGSAFR